MSKSMQSGPALADGREAEAWGGLTRQIWIEQKLWGKKGAMLLLA